MPFRIIQGGMGVGVSGWQLARAVSRLGQLGVVSGTGLAMVFARRLESGDPGGHLRRALRAFPAPDVAERLLSRFFSPGGRGPDEPFTRLPLPGIVPHPLMTELTLCANFAEVWLAKEGHGGAVGVNLLEKTQVMNLPALYGAMLAGVDYVLMGAGIPRTIPGALDALAAGARAELRVDVHGAAADEHFVTAFDPVATLGMPAPELGRPQFLAIVSSSVLAQTLARKSNGRVDGFVVEGSTAGGHNAPPRGPATFNAQGEPCYGPRDAVDPARMRDLGLPFWLAGGYGHPGRLAEALAAGATGVQVGTAFAFCAESGIADEYKRAVLDMSRAGTLEVRTDPDASPTSFPFKVVQLPGTLSDDGVYARRPRDCNVGFLRQPYRRDDGRVGYRCPAEPVDQYAAKGGRPDDARRRRNCLCNSLIATIGLGQRLDDGGIEPAVVTAGYDATGVARFLKDGAQTYSAADVVAYLLGQ